MMPSPQRQAFDIGTDWARVDRRGGYNTIPTMEAAVGVIYPHVKLALGVEGRTDSLVDVAARAYIHGFI